MVQDEDRTVRLAFSSDKPLVRWWGIEILDHSSKAMRTTRTKGDGLPLLFNHDRDVLLGRLKDIGIEDGVARGTARFDDFGVGDEKFRQVKSGSLTDVSVGYDVHFVKELKVEDLDEDLLKLSAREKLPVYLINDWEPFEGSLVTVAADPTVGVGRAKEPGEGSRTETDVTPGKKNSEEERQMPPEKLTVEEVAEEVKKEREKQLAEVREKEKDRMREIRKLAEEWKLPKRIIEAAETDGTTIEQFRGIVLNWVSARKGNEPLETPRGEIGLSDKEARDYSFLRAVRAAQNNDWRGAEFERECSEQVAKQVGRDPRKFFLPYDVITVKRDDPVFRQIARRDLNVTTGTAGGYLKGTEHLAGSFIELLRARLVAARAGVQVLSGLVGDIDIPKQSAAATAYWISTEGGDLTESAPTFGQVAMSPKDVGGYVDITRRLMRQSSPAVDTLVINDLTSVITRGVDLAVFHGSGASGQPTGIENVSGIGSFTAASITRALALGAITDVENANADENGMSWVTNPTAKGVLRGREQGSAGYPLYLWGDDNRMLGYPGLTSTQISSGYLFFGDFTQAIVGEWGVLDINIDDKSLSISGGTRIVAFMSVDVAVRQAGAFTLGTSLS